MYKIRREQESLCQEWRERERERRANNTEPPAYRVYIYLYRWLAGANCSVHTYYFRGCAILCVCVCVFCFACYCARSAPLVCYCFLLLPIHRPEEPLFFSFLAATNARSSSSSSTHTTPLESSLEKAENTLLLSILGGLRTCQLSRFRDPSVARRNEGWVSVVCLSPIIFDFLYCGDNNGDEADDDDDDPVE
jgi:hypothetical protein